MTVNRRNEASHDRDVQEIRKVVLPVVEGDIEAMQKVIRGISELVYGPVPIEFALVQAGEGARVGLEIVCVPVCLHGAVDIFEHNVRVREIGPAQIGGKGARANLGGYRSQHSEFALQRT
jgi:hypothetical protein